MIRLMLADAFGVAAIFALLALFLGATT